MHLLQICPQSNSVEFISQFLVDLGETGRWNYYSLQAIFFYCLVFLAIYSYKSPSTNQIEKSNLVSRIARSDLTFIISSIFFIMISRIPLAVKGTTNIDENTWIAIARTLAIDPRYWLSVDGHTGGPLVPFTLLSVKIFGLPIDSGSLKIMSALLMAMSVSFLFLFFIKFIRPNLARLLILPLIIAISMTDYYDIIAYNSEHIVILILSLALVFFGRYYKTGPGTYHHNVIVLGILLGLVPYAKLQGAPIALTLGLFACYISIKSYNRKSLLLLVSYSLLPTIFLVSIVWAYGGIADFWTSYIEGNLIYASRNPTTANPFSEKMVLLFNLLFHPPVLKFFLYYALTSILLSVIWISSFGQGFERSDLEKLMLSIALFLVSLYCVVVPNNAFHHYILLALFPLTILTGVAMDLAITVMHRKFIRYKLLSSNSTFGGLLAIIFIIPTSLNYFQQHFSYRPNYLDFAYKNQKEYIHYPEIASIIKKYYYPGAQMAIWGWSCELYEDTNMLMGTRYTNCPVIESGPLESYYGERYLEDLVKNRPLFIVETIGPNFRVFQDRSTQGYEKSIPIKNFIDSEYELISTVNNSRIFKIR